MSAVSPPEPTSFPYPLQIVYDGRTDRLRVAVDVAPADCEDLTVAVGSRRLRIAVATDDGGERTLTPLPRGIAFGDDREAIYNNGILTITLETTRRRRR